MATAAGNLAKAVQKLTRALNWSKSPRLRLRRRRHHLADSAKFDELVAQIQTGSTSLCPGHFILLATVTDDARREKLIEDSLHNRWTVR